MKFLVLFIINLLILNSMLKYALVEFAFTILSVFLAIGLASCRPAALTESVHTETVIETVTVRFDTASPDSITGKYSVKEITKSLVTRGKAVRISDTSLRLYAIIALIFLTLAVGRIVWEKITDFIYSREKK